MPTNTVTAAIDLTPFCSTDRPQLSGPFVRGEHVYATNGHILVRVPLPNGNANTYEAEGVSLAAIEAMLKKAFYQTAFVGTQIPELPDPVYKNCECCGAPTSEEHLVKTKVGKSLFNAGYLRKFKRLSGARLHLNNDKNGVALVKFDQGIGVIMPLKQKD